MSFRSHVFLFIQSAPNPSARSDVRHNYSLPIWTLSTISPLNSLQEQKLPNNTLPLCSALVSLLYFGLEGGLFFVLVLVAYLGPFVAVLKFQVRAQGFLLFFPNVLPFKCVPIFLYIYLWDNRNCTTVRLAFSFGTIRTFWHLYGTIRKIHHRRGHSTERVNQLFKST